MRHTNTLMERHAAKEALRTEIIDKIRTGELPPGYPIGSEKQLCEDADLSLFSVQAVLHQLVEEGWIYRKRRVGTFVSDSPPVREVMLGTAVASRVLLLQTRLLTTAAETFVGELDHALEQYLAAHGVELLYSPKVYEQLEGFLERNAESVGVIVVPVLAHLYPVVNRFSIPCMGIVNLPTEQLSVPFDGVATDNEAAACEAVKHLIELGHKRICHIGAKGSSSGDERFAGYRRAHEDAGLAVDESLVEWTKWSLHEGYEAMLRVLARDTDVTALFAASDTLAIGAMRAIHESGRKVPDDMSVVGFDDRDEAQHSMPPLTTMRVDLAQFGQTAGRMVLDRLKNPDKPNEISKVSSQLILRDSTRRLD